MSRAEGDAEGRGADPYAEARLYDIAFGYRDFNAEVADLITLCRAHGGFTPTSMVELAAGPAGHARAFVRAGIAAQALDMAPAMQAYALDQAKAEGLALDYRLGDMAAFTLSQPVDLVCIMLDSISHLLENGQALGCFASAAAALRPGGLLVVETPHPVETFGMGEMTVGAWTEKAADGTEVMVEWGRPGDRFDPIAQVRWHSVAFTVRAPGKKRRVLDFTVPQRRYTAQEMDLLARAAGLRTLARYGALDPLSPADVPEDAFRLISVMGKV